MQSNDRPRPTRARTSDAPIVRVLRRAASLQAADINARVPRSVAFASPVAIGCVMPHLSARFIRWKSVPVHARPMISGRRFVVRACVLSLLVALGVPLALPAQAGAAQAGAAQGAVTVIIVRHAERADTDPRDPPLDSIGRVRADALAEAIGGAGVQAIYVTQYRRTLETAEPLARALGLTPQVIAAGNPVKAHAVAVARTLLEKHRGQTVLVVGHSNTVGLIARALGAPAREDLENHEYEHLYIVTSDGQAPAKFISVRFGPPNPAVR